MILLIVVKNKENIYFENVFKENSFLFVFKMNIQVIMSTFVALFGKNNNYSFNKVLTFLFIIKLFRL